MFNKASKTFKRIKINRGTYKYGSFEVFTALSVGSIDVYAVQPSFRRSIAETIDAEHIPLWIREHDVLLAVHQTLENNIKIYIIVQTAGYFFRVNK